ncbi:hypothetical protein BJ912DRAFT_908730 [Pholiota molesta]|nr:hypothetical protein BJ912DRAFT_908730 [Pholiota molesta]
MGFREAFHSGLASIFDRKKRANDGNGNELLEVDPSQPTIGREIPFQRQTTQRGSEQQVTDTSVSLARERRERTHRWSEQQMVDTNRATMGRKTPFQRETTQRGSKRQEADTSQATIRREISFQRETTQRGSGQQMADTSQATKRREIPFQREKTQRGSKRQEADTSRATLGREKPFQQERMQRGSKRQEGDTSQATIGREIPFQRERTHRETTVGQSQRQKTNDANPAANAMFNGSLGIYGGNFVQNNAAKRTKDGFTLLRERVASSAFHNSAQRVDPPRCHPNTRVEVMAAIYKWIIKSGYRDEYLLWLNGAAAAGKSAIMQSIAERCVLAAIAVASFFFVRSDSTRNTMAPLVATLAYQLIQAIPDTADNILLTIERNPLIFEQSLEDQLRELIIEPLLRLPPHLQRLFVVFIDGLDECNDRAHQSNLLKILGNISSVRNIPVVFVIASRREPQIEAEFCREQVPDILTIIPLDDMQASKDIRRYLNAKFKEIKNTHLRRRSLAPDWPTSAVIEQIVDKSSGQFIYASVVIGYISLPHAHPALQLDIINGIRPRNLSENPFTHLDALYQYIFSQVKQLDAVRNVLAWHLIHSRFTIRGLESLFQLAAGELEVLFADLNALVRCSSDTPEPDGMKILHASLPDFLLDKSRSGHYYINLDEYRTNLLSLLLERPCPIPNAHSHEFRTRF